MDTKQQTLRENKEEKQKNEGKRDGPQSKHKAQQQQQQQQLNKNSPPPSSSSSPSHEFSFTISLHPSKLPDKNTKSTPSFAIDLSPADEIFFHGHLLPLHLLSHLPVSPRTSTNSLDSFTLPIKELLHDNNDNSNESSDECRNISQHNNIQEESNVLQSKGRGKSKSFSLFGMQKRRKDQDQQKEQNKQRKNFGDLVKRYMKLVKPFLSFRGNRGDYYNRDHRCEFDRQPYSFSSGNLLVKSKRSLRGRRGGFTAPASMHTSPTNSGLLVASGSVTPTTTTTKSDSTMEELQAAIQAAIAHCKNSIAQQNETNFP